MTAAGQPGTRMRPSCETILAMACARMTVGLASKPATGMMAAVAEIDHKIDGDGAARLPMTQHKDYQRNLRRRRRRTEHPPTAMRCARLLDIADIFVTDLGRPAAPHPRAMAGKQVDVARRGGTRSAGGSQLCLQLPPQQPPPEGPGHPRQRLAHQAEAQSAPVPYSHFLFTLSALIAAPGPVLHLNLNRQRFDRQVCVNLCKASPGDRTIVLIDFAPDI